MVDESVMNFDNDFYMKLLLEEIRKFKNVFFDSVEFVFKFGYVMKLWNKKEEEVFINICILEKVFVVKDVSDEELVKVL